MYVTSHGVLCVSHGTPGAAGAAHGQSSVHPPPVRCHPQTPFLGCHSQSQPAAHAAEGVVGAAVVVVLQSHVVVGVPVVVVVVVVHGTAGYTSASVQ